MGTAESVTPFVAAALVATAGQSISLAAFQALIPELVAPQDWGAASGYQGAASLIGSIAGLATASLTSPATTFYMTAAVVVAGVVTVALTPEGMRVEIENVRVRDWHDFVVAFVARFWTIFGLTLLMTFALYFFHDVLKVKNPAASTGLLGGLSLAGAVISSLWMGALSDRVPRKLIVALAGVPMALAVAGFSFFPDPRAIMGFAVLFGLGYGAFASTGWALAIDSIPQIRNVARDLGVWGIATGLPAVVAPIFGGWLLSRFAIPAQGYRALFIAASISFVLGSLIVLWVRGRQPARGWPICFQALALLIIRPYFLSAYRIRGYGRLPKERGATIVVANHAHDLDDTAVVVHLSFGGPWNRPIYTTSSRRVFEPGFMAMRAPWLRPLLRRVNAAWLFLRLGLLPIENDLFGRSVAGLAWLVAQRHGNLLLADVFTERALSAAGIEPDGQRLGDIYDSSTFRRAQETRVSLNGLREPYRTQTLEDLRAVVKSDLERILEVLRSGATFYLTPEGRHTRDGRLGRLRQELKIMAPLAQVYLAAISYDVYIGQRLNMIFRIAVPEDPHDIPTSLQAARVITVSQLLADWLTYETPAALTSAQAAAAVKARLATLPANAHIDADLQKDPERLTRAALAKMLRLGTLEEGSGRFRLTDRRAHPNFPEVADMVAYQSNFFAETVEALRRLEQRRRLPAGDVGQVREVNR
jgi:MFS family permease